MWRWYREPGLERLATLPVVPAAGRRLTMRIRYHEHGGVTIRTEHIVEGEAAVNCRRLRRFNDDLKSLDVGLERHRCDGSKTVRLVLYLPGTTIAASGHGQLREAAVREDFADLLGRAGAYLAKPHGEAATRRTGHIRDIVEPA
jgi:hypothetical protein